MPAAAATIRRLTPAPLLLTAALGLFACRPPTSKLPLDQLEAKDETATKQGEARETLEPLPVEAPVDLLPAEVPVLAEAIDPAAVLGLLTPLDEYPQFNTARAALRGELGVDLLDATQWQQVGLDAHGPMGFGVLDLEAQGLFVYASLTDAPVFERFITRVAERVGVGDDLSSAEVGRARVYRLGDELSVILREGVAVLVFVDRPERAPRDYVATIATIDPREALSRDAGFSWARQQITAADDGLIFVAPTALLEQIDREQRENDGSDYGVRYALDELDRARALGEPVAVIRELEARVEEERRWQQERQAAQASSRELAHTMFGPIGAGVFAADLRSEGIEAHGRLLIPGVSLLRDVFEPVEAESPLFTALDQAPLAALDGRANMPKLVQLVEMFARADGESLDAINGQLRQELGVDVLGELIPSLTGAGGLMLTQARAPDPKRLSEVSKSLGLAAYVQLSNADVMRRLLDAAAASPAMGGLLSRAKRGDAWLLRVPKWHEVQLSIVGDRLIASTDMKLATRVRDAQRGAQADRLADPKHPLRGPTPTPALRFYQRWQWIAMIDAHDPWEQDVESMLYDLNSHATLTPDEAAKVPRSREFKRKYKELQKVVDQLNAAQRRRASAEFERMLEFTGSLGDAGLQIERLSDGLGVRAQWRMDAGVTPLAIPMRWFMMFDRQGDEWVEYEELQSRVYQLQQELNMIRQADLDAAA